MKSTINGAFIIHTLDWCSAAFFCAFFTSYWNHWISSEKHTFWIEKTLYSWKLFYFFFIHKTFFILVFCCCWCCSCSHSCYFTQVTQHIFHVHNPQLREEEKVKKKIWKISMYVVVKHLSTRLNRREAGKKALRRT